jgi:hypothetical protein
MNQRPFHLGASAKVVSWHCALKSGLVELHQTPDISSHLDCQ